uniref:Uncharacterized protein n=1 Tax=viral metagenome TaxID=1070528 RepID=A0A6M3JHH6_9ZZZZ
MGLVKSKRILTLGLDDRATSDDPLEACLERLGYSTALQAQLKASIADKLTPNLFTGQIEQLDGMEKNYQDAVDKCIKRLKGAC